MSNDFRFVESSGSLNRRCLRDSDWQFVVSVKEPFEPFFTGSLLINNESIESFEFLTDLEMSEQLQTEDEALLLIHFYTETIMTIMCECNSYPFTINYPLLKHENMIFHALATLTNWEFYTVEFSRKEGPWYLTRTGLVLWSHMRPEF